MKTCDESSSAYRQKKNSKMFSTNEVANISTTSASLNITRTYNDSGYDVTGFYDVSNLTDIQCINFSSLTPGPDQPVPEGPNVLMASLYWPITVVGLIGNLVVLIAFWRERTQLFKVNFNLLLLNLTFVDLFVFIFDLPFITVWGFYCQLWPHNVVACTLILFADWTLPLVSILTTVAISVDRYWAACWSIQYRKYNTRKRTIIFVILIW